MIRTVDLVIAGGGDAAIAAATDALRRGGRVLIVLSSEPGEARRLRRNLGSSRLTVITHAEVVCVDGVDGVEAVVMRETRTGLLRAVNTRGFVDATKRRQIA